jgi:hypothetical protein
MNSLRCRDYETGDLQRTVIRESMSIEPRDERRCPDLLYRALERGRKETQMKSVNRTNVFTLMLAIAVVYATLAGVPPTHGQQQSGQSTIRLTKVSAKGGASVQVSGRIVGFSCAPNSMVDAECFVATAD